MLDRLLRLPFLFCLLAFAGYATSTADEEPRIELGSGQARFERVTDWAQLPDGVTFGNTHGCIVVDSEDRVYVNTDSERAVMVFEADGTFVNSWGAELAGGLHGMTLVREGDKEFLYLAHTGRHEVLKTTLAGEVLWRVGYPAESKIYEDASGYRPTSVAVCPDGRFFVTDGYGSSWIHEYDAEQQYVRSVGGPGSERGLYRTPHGIDLDTSKAAERLIVADRENHRLQVLDLQGATQSVFDQELRRPCHTHSFRGQLAVADLAGRVTLLDADGELIAHLGDNPDPKMHANNGVPPGDWRDGEFIAPHCANWDSQGNLYVMDWVSAGRISKLRRLP